MRGTIITVCGFCLMAVSADAADVKHVVLISVDGLAASYLSDPLAELPTLRMLAKQGAVAEGMITTFPSVTWPSHTSLITGTTARRHGVIGNTVFDRRANRELVYIGDPELEKSEAIRVPTLYDVAHAAGMKSASVIWPCCNGASSLQWVIPDSNKQAIHTKYTTAGFVNELKSAGIDISLLGTWGWEKKYSAIRDELYSHVSRYLLEKHQPNLLLLHYIAVDGVEHNYGPQTPEAYAAVAASDLRVKEIWEALQQPPFVGHSTLFIVSDHGFAPIEKSIRPNVELKRLGLIETDDQNKPTRRQVWCVTHGGSAYVYILDDAGRAELLPRLKESLSKLEGVQRVIEAADFEKLGLPHPDENPEAPHLILATGPGFAFDNAVSGDVIGPASATYKGTHGHLPEAAYMHATFIAVGTGIKPGIQLKTIRNIDVAPTISKLLGLDLPSAEGRVLTEILAK